MAIEISYRTSHDQVEDRLVMTADGWRFAEKRVIYDTLRVQTLLATPI